MNREAWLRRLREGLQGLSPTVINEMVADYETHFAEGVAAGRSEEAVAQALGDPARLAKELKAEQGLRRWEETRNPGAAAGAIFAVLGLGAIDLLILLPILIGVGSAIFGLFMGMIGVFIAGAAVFGGGLVGAIPSDGPNGSLMVLVGLGLMSGSIGIGAILSLTVIGLVNLLVRYGRLHYRLLQPAVAT